MKEAQTVISIKNSLTTLRFSVCWQSDEDAEKGEIGSKYIFSSIFI